MQLLQIFINQIPHCFLLIAALIKDDWKKVYEYALKK